ncbi:hypothetical protein CK203_064669 [Vitis vinifera]|uniref:Integrase catalytic domain-containing protein n=1 Tax=Vitis vinifera TaxID=29760 RepID=A0A438FQ75_VITVI|nr:hypothetical protein CK203_064669 [Vitis vinifera]
MGLKQSRVNEMITELFSNFSKRTSSPDLDTQAIINDGGTHFCNKPFETLLAKYGVKHKAYRTTYKTILGMSPYRLVYEKHAISPLKCNTKLGGQSNAQHGLEQSRHEEIYRP